MNQKLLLSAAMLLGTLSVQATERQFKSPDGKITVTVNDDNGKPSYSVTCGGEAFILPSPLGLVTNIGDFSRDMSISNDAAANSIRHSYSLPNIKTSHVDYTANEAVVSFSQKGKKIYDVTFRISNTDVAFRYTLQPQGSTRCAVVKSETTGFTFPDGTTTFLCPQSKAMTGFARTAPSYETSYTPDAPMGGNGLGEGFSFPCLFHIKGGKGWALVSETGLDGQYCASRLLNPGQNATYIIGYPQAAEMNGVNSAEAAIALPGNTPWRTITLGQTLAPIVETTVPWDVVEPKYEATANYAQRYGRGTWSWIIGMDGSCNYNEQKRYIDFAHDMGYESVLIDALWDTQIGRDKIKQLADYAKTQGVSLYLWYNSNGYWNDAPQGPRGIMDNTIARRKEMAWMKQTGIRGIKVDFFGSDKQAMMQVYEDILADANDYGIMVIFHGCTLPRGWERMYPNYIASEAVLASENLHFGQGSCDAEAFNATIHPFIRNTVGSMDFGGSTLNKYYSSDNKKGTHRVTSDVFALATAVLFQSAVQHFALAPNNLTDAPAWAVDFMKNVPTTWDETRFIEGYPGKYVVMARRHKDTWYICAVNAQKTPATVQLKLPKGKEGQPVRIYSDDAKLQGSMQEIKKNKKKQLKLTIPCNGGFVVVL